MEDGVKLVYSLKQQTPIIHFQYAEEGVCLRASEAKPKLDKFLLDRIRKEKGNVNYKPWKDKDYSHWYTKASVAPDHDPALCYKMKISVNPKEEPIKSNERSVKREIEKDKFNKDKIKREAEKNGKLIPGAYFGNMGAGNGFKETVFYCKPISLEIICFNKELRKYIDDNIDLFFLSTNFGTRQSKGYGSFVVEGKVNENRLLDLGKKIWYFKTENIEKDHGKGALSDIADIYAVMKSGINLTKHEDDIKYVKGYIFQYFLKERIRSEKAFVKRKIIFEEEIDANQKNQYQYVRGLLGINDGVNYRSYDKKTATINITKEGNHKEEKIERFHSPILFKVIGDKVYIIPGEIPKEILGAIFCFVPYKDKERPTGKEDYCLTIPDEFDLEDYCLTIPKEFNLEKFLRSFVEAFNNKDGHEWGKTKGTKKPIYMKNLTNGRFAQIKKIQIREIDRTGGSNQ